MQVHIRALACGGRRTTDPPPFPTDVNEQGLPPSTRWKGNLFVSALAQKRLFRLRLDGEKVAHQEELLVGTGRVRDVRAFDDGFLYVIYDGDKIVRLVPAD